MITHIPHPAEASEQRRSLRQPSAMSPTTVRKAVEDNKNDEDLFSPTSAAALALSTLHHFGAQRENRGPPDSDLKGTRLFNTCNGNRKDTATTKDGVTYSYRSTSPAPPSSYPSGGRGHPFEFSSQTYNNRDPSVNVNQSHSHASTWGGVNPSSAYPYTFAQTDSRSSSARASPTYPDELRSSYSHHHVSNKKSKQQAKHPSRKQTSCLTLTAFLCHYLQQRRASPVSMLGPTPMSHQNSFHHPHPPTVSNDTAKFARLASCASTLVTPTPKKAKLDHPEKSTTAYSRKKKSLGILAENFLNNYQGLPKGSIIVVDEAAVKLGVERRRIYDVVNILESICLVCKKHKNTYTWMGMEHLDAVFGRLQSQAIAEYPQDAQKFLGSKDRKPFVPVPLKAPRKQSKTKENKSLAKLSQEFLQVFLVGHETLSLPEASDKIQGTTSMEELIAMGSNQKSAASTEKELKAAAARGLKTKIRRLYDIANVFLSVGLLKKVESGDSSRRPNFSWSYRVTAKELYQLHRPNNNNNNDTTIPVVTQEEDNASSSASSATSSPVKQD
jgi:hypothetical protein